MWGWGYNERDIVVVMGGELPLGQKFLEAVLADEEGRFGHHL